LFISFCEFFVFEARCVGGFSHRCAQKISSLLADGAPGKGVSLMALKGMKIAAVVLSFAVFAIVTGCNGGYYSVTGGSGTLSAPTGLTAAAGNAQVALSWTAPSSGLTPGSTTPESYNLYYSTSTGVTTASGTKISGITPTLTRKPGSRTEQPIITLSPRFIRQENRPHRVRHPPPHLPGRLRL